MTDRRNFLKSAAAIAAGTIAMPSLAGIEPVSSPRMGIQLYSLFSLMDQDPRGTLEKLAQAGFKELEFAGPYYFSPQEEVDASILIKMFGLKNYGYYGLDAKELKEVCADLGMSPAAAHVSTITLESNIDAVMEAGVEAGHDLIICPMLMGATLDIYKDAADKFNQYGEKCKEAGMQFAYHNHSFEFGEIDGVRPLDYLMEQCDEDLVKFELDVFWAETAGVNGADYIGKNRDRIVSLHIKDMKERRDPDNAFSTFTDMESIQNIFNNMTPVGSGVIDYKGVMKAAQKSSVRHYFLEQDFPPDQEQFYKEASKGFNALM